MQLLAPSMCKMAAKKAGKDDAWLVEDGFVTEGTSNNAWIVTRDGTRRHPRPLDRDPARHHPRGGADPGARGADPGRGAAVHPGRGGEAAAEAFITAASAFVTPVVEIDGRPVGDGRPGPVTRRLRELYLAESRARAT